MSTALELMKAQLAAAVENGPSSESFTLDPDDTAISFKGIFDNAYEEGDKDGGHVSQQTMTPRILVSEILSGMVQQAAVRRESGGEIWHISRAEKDEMGVSVIWLY